MSQKTNKVIISCAITGSIHTPSMSDALPITPDQIAEQAIAAAEGGAAILHLHARDPKDGRPTPDPKVFMQFLPRIKQSCDAVLNITTGGSVKMTVEERLAAPLVASPEMCSLNMGSMNFALYPMAAKIQNWKYDWEKDYLLGSDDNIFRNTFRDIETIYKRLGEGHGTRFEHECYDVGHLYNLAHCIWYGDYKPAATTFYSDVDPSDDPVWASPQKIDVRHDILQVRPADFDAVIMAANYTSVRLRYPGELPEGAAPFDAWEHVQSAPSCASSPKRCRTSGW